MNVLLLQLVSTRYELLFLQLVSTRYELITLTVGECTRYELITLTVSEYKIRTNYSYSL